MSNEVTNNDPKQTSEVGGEIIKIHFQNFYDDTKTKVKNDHVFFVKAEYAKQYPDYGQYNSIELFKNTNIQQFLHNPNGPALVDNRKNIKNYFLDGQLIMEDTEEFKKIKHNEMFNDKVDQILAE
jgi:hypothetical protein